jgi:hypothetical protein
MDPGHLKNAYGAAAKDFRVPERKVKVRTRLNC